MTPGDFRVRALEHLHHVILDRQRRTLGLSLPIAPAYKPKRDTCIAPSVSDSRLYTIISSLAKGFFFAAYFNAKSSASINSLTLIGLVK